MSRTKQAPSIALREELASVHARIAPQFGRPEVRDRAGRYLVGLLGPVERRTGWRMAEEIGEERPDGVQRLLNAARWDADAVRDDLRGYVVERLGDPGGVLALVETGFPKKGTKSVGVARQRDHSTAQIQNCQVGLSLAYFSRYGWAFIDRALYLPKEWTEDEHRLRRAGVPERVAFATKGVLARRMLERAFGAKVPATWVIGGGILGEDEGLRRWLEARGRPYLLAVSPSHRLMKRLDGAPILEPAEDVPAVRNSWSWKRAEGGPASGLLGDREWVRHELAYWADRSRWERWLLTGHSVTEPDEYSYYRAYVPKRTSLAELAVRASIGAASEEGIECAKDVVGLDQYEVRRWEAWHRHITLGLLAHAALQVARARSESEGDYQGPA